MYVLCFNIMFRIVTVILICFSVISVGANPLVKNDVREDSLPFFQRFSFHTNALDWLLATPGVGVELDLSGTPRIRYSVLLQGKYNWNTRHTVSPRFVYNIGAVKVEARKYWRTGGKWEGHRFRPFSRYEQMDSLRPSFSVARDTTVSLPRWGVAMLRRNVISGRTFESPRTYRAYYVGVYAGYEKFTYAFGRKGYQGDSYNFGFSGGWSTPLYFFKGGHSLDLDLGMSVGAKMLAYDKFGYEEETGCYVAGQTKGRHFLPYPMVQEISLGLVFRLRSIKHKVQGGAELYELWEDSVYIPRRFKRERKRARNWELRDSTFKAHELERSMERKKRDSLREDRLRADSMEYVLKGLKAEQARIEEARNDSLELQEAEAGIEAKKAQKAARKKEKDEAKALKKKRKEEERQKARLEKQMKKKAEREQKEKEDKEKAKGKEDEE